MPGAPSSVLATVKLFEQNFIRLSVNHRLAKFQQPNGDEG